MGATAINGDITSSNWASAKPKDYKNADLDKAISGWEAVAKKTATDPTMPAKLSIKGYESFVKDAKDLVKLLKEWDTALAAVVAAAGKVSTECRKLCDKLEGEAKVAYFDAAGSASAIGDVAATMKGKLI